MSAALHIVGQCPTPVGEVPVVGTALNWRDVLGAWKMRWAISRMDYKVDPGLYAVGEPSSSSPVLVSANYKFSFDLLRQALAGRDCWILVLDTMGVNVWCAAGKGTFGTDELVNRISVSRLADVVIHRRLIVPQLGAPGVAAHEVKKRSGFKVVYGPVRATDLPAFLDGGLADEAMRTVNFTLYDRLVLVPVEFSMGLKKIVFAVAVLFILSGITTGGYSSLAAIDGAPEVLYGILGGFFAGAAVTPVLLPLLPGRAFSVKGIWVAVAIWAIGITTFMAGLSTLSKSGWLLMTAAVGSFAAMNFTGASTYTSLSGVKKEMRYGIPAQAIVLVVGCILWIAGRVSS